MMRKQNRRILQKITAAALSAVLAVGMAQGGVPGWVFAQEDIGSQGDFSAAARTNDNETWEEGSTISYRTISGGTESDPVVITVTGNVTVTGEITISGHVKFTGGGVLKWASTGSDNALEVAEGASAVFENVTLNGDENYFRYSALLFRGTVEFGEGTTIQNFYSGTTSNAVPGHKGVIAVCDEGVLNIKEGAFITGNKCESGIISLYQTDDGGSSMPITAEVNIEGGRIEGNTVNNENLGVVWNWFGNLNITGGTVTASANEYAVYTQGNESRYAGTTEIYGGTFTGEQVGAVCSGRDPGNTRSKIIIAGGVFKGKIAARVNYGTIDVRGGKYEGSQYALMSSTGQGALTVQGGEFLGGIAAYSGNITTKTQKVVVGESADSANDWDKSTSLNNYKYVAIGDSDNAYVHTHTKIKHESTATCTEPGTGEYWQCEGEDGCGKLFAEDNDKTEIAKPPYKEATGCALEESVWKYDKDTHWHQCICGKNKSQAEAHTFESDSVGTQVCSVCGYMEGAGPTAIEDVENKITAIASETEYTQEWAQKVEAAQKAYSDLNEEEKAKVSAELKQDLEDAGKKYDNWKAAQEVKNQIEEIGEVTAGNASGKKEQIESAREAYDSLTEEQKKLITPEEKKKLTDAEKMYDNAAGGKNQEAADAVKEKIDQIPSPVTSDQETGKKIEDAKEAYENLTGMQKDMLPEESVKKLEEAVEDYNKLVTDEVRKKIEAIGEVTLETAASKKELIEEARKAYDRLTEEQKKQITPEEKKKLTDAEKIYDTAAGGKNQEAADAVKEKIDQIPSVVTSDQETGKKIEDAKEAYENLTGMQKDMLPEESIKKLEEAVEDYNKLAADEVRKKIEAIGSVTPETVVSKKELIEEAREAYDRLTEEQKKLITPEEKKKLTDAEKIYDDATGGKNQEAADAVREKIEQIPSVVTSDEETGKKIEDAKEAYENLTGMQKDMLPEESIKKLEEAVEDYNKLAADEVRKKIEAIGEVTPETVVSKKELIEEAREAYDRLTEEQKKQITPEEKKKLTDAEKIYDDATGGKNQEAADAVKEKIDQIPSVVTSDQETGKKIEDAKEAYENLTGMQKDMLPEESVKKLEEAVEDYNKLAADEVRKKIEEIGSVTPETVVSKKELIEEAREAYDRLTEEQKKLITPEEQKKLTDAEKMYDDATGGNNQEVVDAVKEKIDQIPSPVTSDQETGKKIEEAREAYDRLTEEQKKLITPEDKKKLTDAEKAYDDATGGKNQEAADAVKEKIDQIPSQITTDEETKQKIEDAKKAYEALTTTQKDMVPEASKKKLEDAEKEYKKQEEKDKQAAEEVKKKIDAIGEVTPENVSGKKEQIEEARKAYDGLTEVQKKYITPEDKKKLTDAEKVYDDATGGKNQEAADTVKEKIDQIPSQITTDEETKQKLEDAKKAYEDLTTTQKDMVPEASKKKLEDAEEEYKKQEEKDKQAAEEVKKKIDAIGEVTLENVSGKKEQIEEARKAYDGLTEVQKKYITPEDKKKLTDAEKTYDDATGGKNQEAADTVKEKIDQIPSQITTDEETKQKLEDAKKAYEDLTTTQKDMVPEASKKKLEDAEKEYKKQEEKDKQAAEEVKKKIDAIGEVTPENVSGKKEQIEEARKAYDGLTEAQKKHITPEDKKKLTDAEKTYDNAAGGKNQAAANAVKEKIDQIPMPVTVDWDTKKKIEEARKVYDGLTGTQKGMVPEASLKKLEDAEREYRRQVSAEDESAVQNVMNKINAIGTVVNTDQCGKKIKDARAAYSILTENQKKLFPKDILKKLTDAEAKYAKLNEKPSQNQQQIDNIADKLGVSKETAKQIQKVAEELGVEVETLLVTDKQLTASKTEADTKGSTFSKLLLKAVKVKTKSVTLKWKKVKGADGYMVYGSPCNQKPKLIKTVKKNSTSFTYKKAKKGKSYKFTVRAYKKIGGKKVTIAVSKRVHLHTAGSKYGNPKGVKVNKKKVTVKKGKTFRIKASNIKPKKRLRKHRVICYESSNKKVATVTKKGVIKGKKKGTCKVYVYAQNGVYKTITVKVK